MKKLLVFLFVLGCGPAPVPSPADDEDPRHCSHEYPIDDEPTLCESTSYGDCCTWEVDEDGEDCRYDYCSYYGSHECDWRLQYTNCS